jgi:hypothetical protein
MRAPSANPRKNAIAKPLLAIAVLIVATITIVLLSRRSAPTAAITSASATSRSAEPVNAAMSKIESPAKADVRNATINVGGIDRVLTPNVRGQYPRVAIKAGDVIHAQVPFPEAAAGDSVAVQTEDGGLLQGSATSGRTVVDAKRVASVDFKSAPFEGMQRVTLRYGASSRVLEFWVGPEQPVLVRN